MLFGPAKERVLAGDVDDVATQLLLDQRLGRGSRHQERTLRHHVVLQVPVSDRGVEQRLGQRQASIVDHNVDAAEREQRGVDSCLYGGFIGDVGGDADRDVACCPSPRPRPEPSLRQDRR